MTTPSASSTAPFRMQPIDISTLSLQPAEGSIGLLRRDSLEGLGNVTLQEHKLDPQSPEIAEMINWIWAVHDNSYASSAEANQTLEELTYRFPKVVVDLSKTDFYSRAVVIKEKIKHFSITKLFDKTIFTDSQKLLNDLTNGISLSSLNALRHGTPTMDVPRDLIMTPRMDNPSLGLPSAAKSFEQAFTYQKPC